jgi:putative MATE family efflux protein
MERWNNRALFLLLWPLVVEQLLGVTMGIADTVMVTQVGEVAVSGVSLVDTINNLLILAFSALATGGSVVVSQYIGRKSPVSAAAASRQLIYASAVISFIIMVITLIFQRPALRLIYGNIEPDVMRASEIYFLITTLSYPSLAVYNAAAALFRSIGNSRVPMLIALLVNIMNIAGNALFIFVFHMGVAGAALSTLISRIAAAVILVAMLIYGSYRTSPVSLKGLFHISIEPRMIRNILNVGIPSGIENSMFQFGKILVSRIFTTFGTAAIASNAVCTAITSFSYMPGNAFGLALVTIVGQCIGAREHEGAKRYTVKILKMAHIFLIGVNILILIFMEPLVNCFNLSAEAHRLTKSYLLVHAIMTPIFWPESFTLPNALRAAGDARFCMVVSSITMWTVRVTLAYIISYALGVGPLGVWIAMTGDFVVRSACFTKRWRKGRWREKTVIAEG